MIKYSLKALEDLAALKNDLINKDPVLAIVSVSDLVEGIGRIDKKELKSISNEGLTYYYTSINDHLIFLRIEAGDLYIDRIFNKDLDFIRLALDLEK